MEKFLSQTTFTSQEDFVKHFHIKVPENFNFGYDVVDAWAAEAPNKIALCWTNDHGVHHDFTFAELKDYTDRTASYFQSLGIGHGDMVMLILKRRYEFWFSIIALHKIGAVAIPATHLLTGKDIVYRNNAADIKAIVCAGEEVILKHVKDALPYSPSIKHLISAGPIVPNGFEDFQKGVLGADTFWDYLENYGLFDSTGIDLFGEGTSVFWPGGKDFFTSIYGETSVATASFGQTFKITPIQMATAFASMINGGHLLEPYVVQSVSDDDGNSTYYHQVQEVRQVISEETSSTLRGMLESVVAGPSASGRNAYMAGYRIGGKTGTSQKRDETSGDLICSFMGFAPVDNPKVLVLLAYDSPEQSASNSNYTPSGTYISGGNIAAPMAGQLLADILDYMGVEKQYTTDELEASDTTMINVTGYELTVAKGLLTDRGIRCRTVGSGNTVTGQLPASGVTIPGSSTVILYLGEEVPKNKVKVPNLEGLSPSEAKNTLEEMGLFLRATGVTDDGGNLEAINQSIAANTEVSPGTVVEVRFVSSVIDYADQKLPD